MYATAQYLVVVTTKPTKPKPIHSTRYK